MSLPSKLWTYGTMPNPIRKTVTSGPRLVQASEVSGDSMRFTFEAATRVYMCTGQVPIVRDREPLWRRLEPVDKPEEM